MDANKVVDGGRDHDTQRQVRDSGTNWAEYDGNAAPQISFGQEPEVAINIEEGIRPPSISETQDYNEKKAWQSWEAWRSWQTWKRYIFTWWFLVPVTILAIVALVVPTVVVTQREAKADAAMAESSAAILTGSLSATNSDSLATATSSSPSSTSSPIPGCNSSDFRTNVNWIGIRNGLGWEFALGSAKDAEDCCRQCFNSFDEGCNGWLYMPGNTASVPPCNVIYGFEGPNENDKCPEGKPDIVFAPSRSNDNSFGGAGPCAGRVTDR